MEIIVNAKPEEVAALVLAVQKRRQENYIPGIPQKKNKSQRLQFRNNARNKWF